MIRYRPRAFAMLALLAACAAGAVPQARAQQKEPLVITADKTLEWHRNEKLYVARGNALARQGDAELHGQTLTAAYTEGEKKGMSLSRIDAQGGVLVVSGGSRATGDRGFYDLKTGYSELTGGNLKLTTPTDTVTARDKLTYSAPAKEMTAIGNARAVRGDDVITADRLIGRFIDDAATGQTKLDQLEAIGNVVITTPSEILHGDRGLYNARTDMATINGHVRIDRGDNTITGARGEVDLNTNISRIFGSGAPAASQGSGDAAGQATGDDGRVRGVFFPE